MTGTLIHANDRKQGTRSGNPFRTLGAIADDRGTTVRVWAPDCRRVELVLFSDAAEILGRHALTAEGNGYWSGRLTSLPAGTLYKFRLDGQEQRTFPDPASRFQPHGVHGPSAVVDHRSFDWQHRSWSAPPFERLAIYELHLGTFTPEGTFRAAAKRLREVAALGVTAVELMPVADFAGDRNWGYDGVALYAPARCYGTPDDLRTLIDAAHGYGLAVILDVVYNHLGPDGAYLNAFSPHYFTNGHRSPWGHGVNLDGAFSSDVRRFFIENAIHWTTEYRVDGLRLDATHALVDTSDRHFLAELAAAVRDSVPQPVYVIAEDNRNLARLGQPEDHGGYGLDAVWADDFHHQARVHTAGDREGYYADFTGTSADIARTLQHGWFYAGQYSVYEGGPRGSDPTPLEPHQFVICIQNHDQVGNRADGGRLNHHIDAASYRALSTLLLMAPATPLLFMGQEWAASTPFLFFTDHRDELGRAITEGRRREFQSFAAFAADEADVRIPDPQARHTFERSRLDWSEIDQPFHAGIRTLYRRLLALRRSVPSLQQRSRRGFVASAPDSHTVCLEYPELSVVARLSGGPGEVTIELPFGSVTSLSTEDEGIADAAAPVMLEIREQRTSVRFARPGAVIFTNDLGASL